MATIVVDPDDLAAHTYDASKPPILSRTRRNETELPRVVEVSFLNMDFDYEIGHETQTRQITDSLVHVSIALPLAFTPTEGAQVADILMANQWVERVTYELYLPFFKYWRIEPADILEITYEGATHSVRVSEIEYDLSRTIKIRGVANESTIYTSNAIGGSTELEPGTVIARGPSYGYLLNLPPMSESQGTYTGYWFGAHGILPGWHSAALFRSSDGGTSYDLNTIVNNGIVTGVTKNVLGDGPTTVWDVTNTVTVQLLNGTLSSDTDSNVLAGSNEAYINGEIIRFANASLIAASTFRLSRFMRGLRGTDHYTSAQKTNSRFHLLDTSVFKPISMDVNSKNVSVPHKIAGFGSDIDDVAVTNFTGTSLALEAFAPVHVKGKRSAGDWNISWIRCNRISYEWLDNADVPNTEGFERYDLLIYDSESSVVRTVSDISSKTSSTYTAAQQVTDFGDWQDTLTVEVFQKTASNGRGIGRRVTL